MRHTRTPIRVAIAALALAVLSPTASARGNAVPAPEMAKTVAALSGRWPLTGTALDPGSTTAASVKATIDCRPVAMDAAVNCLIVADVSGTRIEAAAVIGYSPDEHVVRWMEISSTGEYHDHHGPWMGDTIRFVPLAYTASGVTMTERLTVSFPSAGSMKWSVTVETPQGESRLELTGTRRPARPR